jgi:hypothetical protein
MSVNIRKPSVEAVVPHAQPFVIDAELMQEGGVDVVIVTGMVCAIRIRTGEAHGEEQSFRILRSD